MNFGEVAGYKINYHHKGAPRNYTVIKPIDHDRLERLFLRNSGYSQVVGQDHSASKSNRTTPTNNVDLLSRKPPSCSQFLSHEHFYVPLDMLALNDVEYTTLMQCEGELVVLFPFAYHQSFNAGPNITEEIMYASDRWEVFHKEALY